MRTQYHLCNKSITRCYMASIHVESSTAAADKSSTNHQSATAESLPAYVRVEADAPGAAGGSVRSPFIMRTPLAGQQKQRRHSPPSPAAGPHTKRARNDSRKRTSGIKSESSMTAPKSTDGPSGANFPEALPPNAASTGTVAGVSGPNPNPTVGQQSSAQSPQPKEESHTVAASLTIAGLSRPIAALLTLAAGDAALLLSAPGCPNVLFGQQPPLMPPFIPMRCMQQFAGPSFQSGGNFNPFRGRGRGWGQFRGNYGGRGRGAYNGSGAANGRQFNRTTQSDAAGENNSGSSETTPFPSA